MNDLMCIGKPSHICCHIDDSGVECERDAVYVVTVIGSTYEDYTHSCSEHLAALMTTSNPDIDLATAEFIVSPISIHEPV